VITPSNNSSSRVGRTSKESPCTISQAVPFTLHHLNECPALDNLCRERTLLEHGERLMTSGSLGRASGHHDAKGAGQSLDLIGA
jgi:hypothetical protein